MGTIFAAVLPESEPGSAEASGSGDCRLTCRGRHTSQSGYDERLFNSAVIHFKSILVKGLGFEIFVVKFSFEDLTDPMSFAAISKVCMN